MPRGRTNAGRYIVVFGDVTDSQLLGNTVTDNGDVGIFVGGTGITVVANCTFGIIATGIDLASSPACVTPDDTNSSDSGANDLLNYPDLSTPAAGVGQTTVHWSINGGVANAKSQVEFFAATGCTATVRNAQTSLGTRTVTTDGNGNTGGITTTLSVATLGQI